MTLGELRSKHNSLTDEYEKVKRLAEKRGDLSGGEQLKGLDSARSRVKELEEYVFELKEAKKNETERVRELEVVINDLRGWYSSALARVSELEKKQNSGDTHSLASTNTQQDVTRLQQIISTMKEEALTSETTIKDLKKSHGELEDQIKRLRGRFECTGDDMDAIELLTRINCENLLRIEMLSEREAFSNNSFQENQLKLQQNEEEWEERVMALKETLAEMQASYDSVKKELTEKKKANTELKVELESFKESTRKATLKLKTYGDKIETLENTICQLRGTLEEQNEVIELRVSMSGELAEERELLRKRLSAATKDLERARAKCEKLESNISKLEDEKECLAMRLKSTEVKSESLEVINESLQKLRKTENDIVQATEGSSQWQVEQKKMLEKIDALSQTFRKYGTEGSYENESQSSEPSKVQKDLEHYQAEFERSEELNKSYQIEVGRLLKMNTALKEECQQIRFQIDDQKKQVEDLRRLKESYERQSFESSMKLLDILTQFSPESAVSELRQEKERLQQEYDRMSEDNMANSAHVEYLVKNIELLEDRVTDLTCTHKMMKDEAEGLQDTITRQSDRIVDLENLIKRLQNGDEEAKQEPHISPNPSFEWEKQLMDIVSRFTGDDKSDHESLLQKASDRTAVRETLRKQVKDAFEHQSDKIQKLSNNVKTTESLAADAQKQLEALKAANQTILLENKILKTAGKERDQRAQKLQSKLAAENDSLKQAIAKLTRQTAEHQQKIRKLAAKQASLKRKKEAAKQENTAEALREIKSLSANEDQGSLAFSADSDDATTTTNNQSNGGDKSVEVVLVEGESRDDGQS
jgi:chromosome segregation ATPase